MMRRLITGMVVLALTAAVVSDAQAQEEKKKRAGRNAQPFAISQLMKSLEKAELSDEQKAEVKKIVAKHREKLAELQKSRQELLGKEANQKMAAARKAATAEGKKGKEVQAAALAAAGLTEEQTKKFGELQKQSQAASNAIKKEVLAVLSKEQIEKAGIKVQNAGGKAKKKKKNTDN